MEKYFISSTKYAIQERRTKRYGRVYDVVFRVTDERGETHQKKLSGYKSKTEAKEAYTAFATEYCTLVKNNPIKRLHEEPKQQTVRELVTAYLESLNNQNKYSSIFDKSSIYRQYLLPELGDLTPAQLTRERMYQWQDWLWTQKSSKTGEPLSDVYLRKARGFIGSFFSWVESRYGYENPLKVIKIPRRRAPKTRMKFWTRDEFNKFIAVVDDPMYHALFMTLFYTGRRKGEVLALTPDDVSPRAILFSKSISNKTPDSSTYQITSTKAEKVYSTPLCKTLQEELARYQPMSPFFFGGEKPVPLETLRRKFHQYSEKAGVEKIRIHDLRHSFVSLVIHGGANLLVVADLIGDTVEQVTKTYGHFYEEDKQAVINFIG